MNNDKMDYETAADFLGIPRNTLYAMVSKKKVPHYRISKRLVRFSRTELETWLNSKHFNTTFGGNSK